jgi:hypothetical protein
MDTFSYSGEFVFDIPWLVVPSGQKLTSGLLATITLGVVPFCPYAPFSALLPFLNSSW